MNETHDELAGVVDLFGALTREELTAALTELAFKRGEEPDEEVVASTIEGAIDAYALVPVEGSALDESGADSDVDASDGDADDGGVSDVEASDVDISDGDISDGDAGDRQFLIPGPTAFPSLPPAAEDLPHIMDLPRRTIDREAVGATVRDQLHEEATEAVEQRDVDRAEQLLDVSYDVEAWAPVDADGVRETLDGLLEE